MSTITHAIIDTRHHTEVVGVDFVVGGLSLLDRALRLAGVCGCDTATVISNGDEAIGRIVDRTEAKLDTIEVVDAPPEPAENQVWIRSSTVYNRGMVKDAIERGESGEGVKLGDGTPADIGIGGPEPTTFIEDDRFHFRVEDKTKAKTANHALWQDCRKPMDGMVSRHLNRYISIAISRMLAPLGIKPNHISIVTFSLGIAAGVICAMGGYLNFLIAGVLFQINSVVDGCDGELARVKYEFSVLGEWLDTLSDDLSDVFFWAGLGWGAYVTFPPLFGLPASMWLWLGGISVLFKLVSMALYYRWLIANKRGDLLAFTWSFDQDDPDASAIAKALKNLKYLTKKDFIVFACMVLGFIGILPWMLIFAALGNIVVAVGVISQEMANRKGA